MKKRFTLLLIIFSTAFTILNAQTNPALLTDFAVDGDINAGYHFSWAIANNEVVNKFDLQRSTNGRDFTTVAVLPASQKTGKEKYAYNETISQPSTIMYRLKMVSKGQDIYYSNIIIVEAKHTSSNEIKIAGNPVNDKLTLILRESSKQLVDLKVYNLSGVTVLSQKITRSERSNIVSVTLSSNINPGIYVVEVNDGMEKQTAKFVKQ